MGTNPKPKGLCNMSGFGCAGEYEDAGDEKKAGRRWKKGEKRGTKGTYRRESGEAWSPRRGDGSRRARRRRSGSKTFL